MDKPFEHQSRRTFLKQTAGLSAGFAIGAETFVHASDFDSDLSKFSLPLGVYASYEKADLLKQYGCSYIEESVGGFLIPKDGDMQYAKNLRQLKDEKFPIRSYVILLPGQLKTLGPDANHEAILQRTDLALKRAKECGSKYIVFGSGASRVIPEGFDREKAKAQHIELSKKMAPLAEKYGVKIALEPLNRGETNFINSLAEGVEIIDAVNSPSFQLLCDIFHMSKEDEPADQIVKFGKHIVHCHIAEKKDRTPPGVAGDDFRPYLSALKKIKYKGGLSIECFVYQDFDSQSKKGIEVLQKQISEV
ncbi:sugar phosphate isomerase/epimerase [Dyadobacter sp. CY356]|uniref:sugar phosphate isomerase/epimerase family protein n=1 Tax=Dyadobacter sp. CY356 TaxID=2906442 RepID=UPI001F21E521|nr:sugar phosphate isomerase/epimerase family protein [Dyadobacter sp. CY356]MCF0057412.1 sugar phosphate isomerase/epimerase [Dyadobacter sp. CY356]